MNKTLLVLLSALAIAISVMILAIISQSPQGSKSVQTSEQAQNSAEKPFQSGYSDPYLDEKISPLPPLDVPQNIVAETNAPRKWHMCLKDTKCEQEFHLILNIDGTYFLHDYLKDFPKPISFEEEGYWTEKWTALWVENKWIVKKVVELDPYYKDCSSILEERKDGTLIGPGPLKALWE
jgi:hypothetical protein